MIHASAFYCLMIAPEDMIYYQISAHSTVNCQSDIVLVKFNFLGPLFLTQTLLFIKWEDVSCNCYNKH